MSDPDRPRVPVRSKPERPAASRPRAVSDGQLQKRRSEWGGRFLLRIEDIDLDRCRPAFEAAILRDLAWLGLSWEEPVRRQSRHFDDYRAALDVLIDAGLAYPSFLTRGEVRQAVSAAEDEGTGWPRDPDGAPLFPVGERHRSDAERRELIGSGAPFAWRLDMEKALDLAGGDIGWTETGQRTGGGNRARSRPTRGAGATWFWHGRIRPPPTISPWSSTTPCKVSRTSCGDETCSTPPRCTGSFRSCSACPLRCTTTTGSCSGTTDGSSPRAAATPRSHRCARPGSRPVTSDVW